MEVDVEVTLEGDMEVDVEVGHGGRHGGRPWIHASTDYPPILDLKCLSTKIVLFDI